MTDMQKGLGRSPTFLVGTDTQRHNLDNLHRREQHLAEQYQKNKPLCYTAGAYQLTHPLKAAEGHIDADVTCVSPMLVGVADGVSQIADYGIDPSELPKELLKACEELAMTQLMPENMKMPQGLYRGPIPLMREAYESTEAMGSTTALLAVLDNSTVIHGKLHPMIAVLSIGDCEILVLRNTGAQLEAVFHTEMQRIEGNAQCPLQICRIDEAIDPDFDERMPLEVIERGSAVHCLSAYEGDIVVMGSDGVFDNMFLDEIVDICNEFLARPYGAKFVPTEQALLSEVARRIVEACHAKTRPDAFGRWPDAPIGKGGKRDDTCCVVAEVCEWTKARSDAWARVRRQRRWRYLLSCGGNFEACCEEDDENPDESVRGSPRRESRRGACSSQNSDSDDERTACCVS
mmetsp:Transcript_91841/g.179962  ORF Transcript_91841/g.179962 Transcript_91841/m.179962 type:complete len:403 (+) Transcript_91841:1-1209(+)